VELGLAYIRFARDESTYFRLSFVTQISGRESLDKPVITGAYQILFQAVEQGIEDGAFQTTAVFGAEQLAYSLWSIVHGMAMLQSSYLSKMDVDFVPADREALRRFVSGLMQSA